MRKIIIRGAIVVVILLAGTGIFQWHNYQQKIEYRKEALLYFKEEDYSKTISYLEEALKRKSVFAREIDLDMTCYLAESHYQLKEYDKAEKIYNKLINNDSKNAQYYMLKGEYSQDGSGSRSRRRCPQHNCPWRRNRKNRP